MSEKAKTTTFAVLALVVLALAWLTKPTSGIDPVSKELGHEFFPDFHEPAEAASMEITDFNPDTGMLTIFKVNKQDGVWTLPSHSDYPADAKEQLAKAASSLIDLKKLDIAAENADHHEDFGVVEPDPKKITPGSVGVGRLVSMKDEKGKPLASFIIGKQDPTQEGLYFVRIPGEDPVYRTNIDPSKLSTNFKDWIEKDLLEIGPFDIKRIGIWDHTVSIDLRGASLLQRSRMSMDYDNHDHKWSLVKMQVWDNDTNTWKDLSLAPDEELDAKKLDGMKTALDDLQIIDVERKPEGVSGNLRAGEDLSKNQAVKEALGARGFFVVKNGETFGIFSNEGEIRCGTKEGIEYILRFGGTVDIGEASQKDPNDPESKDDPDSNIGRFIMITTEFNESLIDKPEITPLPELPEAPGSERANEGEPAAADKADTDKADTDKPADEPAKQPAADEGACESEDCADGEEAATETAEDAATTDAAADAANAADTQSDEPKSDDATSTAEPPAADQVPDAVAPGDARRAAAIKAAMAKMERQRIEEENQQKLDEYKDKVEHGKERVEELNDRFADWYYIISESTYKKIHLSRQDLIKKKEPPKDATGDAPQSGLEPDQDPFGKFEQFKQKGVSD